MQGLGQILIAVNCSQNLNKENIADKIKAEIEAKLNEENLDKQTKKDLEECFKQWKEDNFDLKKFPYSYSLLHLAAKFNCAKLAKALIESGVDVNDGFPLHCAAQHGHVQVAEILLAAKADVNTHDERGLTALHYAVYLGNKIEMIKSLLRAGATNVQIKCGFTPLHHAAQHGYVQAVETLLKEGGADVNVQDKHGKTPLHRAAQHGHIQVVEILLKEGARVDLQNKNGKTPLHHTAKRGYTQIVEALLRKEASINVQDKHGKTPLYSAIRYGYTQVAEVLLKGGAGVNVQDKEGTTPLDCAYSCNPKVAKLLLDYGADPSCIHRPKAITAGVAVGILAAIVTSLELIYATALPALAIVGITVASALIVGGISYGVAYKSSKHSLNSKLSEVSCSNVGEQTTANSPQ